MDSDRERINDWYAPMKDNRDRSVSLPDRAGEREAGESFPSARENGRRETADPVPEKKRTGARTGVRIAGFALLLLLAIAVSSLALQKVGPGDVTLPSAEEREEMPETPEDFFSQFYSQVETDTAEVDIEPAEERPALRLELQPAGEELSLEELYSRCAPAIVAISAYEGNKIGYSWGSGVILSEDGLILTNTHVLEDSDRAVVTLFDDREFEAKLIGADSISDIALLKIDALDLPTVEFGESARLRVGERVAAIGNPLGESFRNTLTDGIISAIERGMSYQGRSMTLLQTNTAINEGNSGGALFNLQGQVIGITNMKMMSSYSSIEGIGFAIPSATACEVVNALLRDGEVRGRPSIGITVGGIPENASEKYELPDGLYVSAVSKGSDAEKQGIRPGDIITAADGVPVRTTTELSDMKNAMKVGDTITLSVWREGRTMEITVTLMDTNDVY